MTLQKEDIQVLEKLIRRVVREELTNIVSQSLPEKDLANEEAFEKAAAQVFMKHKTVLDALA